MIVRRLRDLVKPRRLEEIDAEHLFGELDTDQQGCVAISDFVAREDAGEQER